MHFRVFERYVTADCVRGVVSMFYFLWFYWHVTVISFIDRRLLSVQAPSVLSTELLLKCANYFRRMNTNNILQTSVHKLFLQVRFIISFFLCVCATKNVIRNECINYWHRSCVLLWNGNEHFDFIKGTEFMCQLTGFRFVTKIYCMRSQQTEEVWWPEGPSIKQSC
jgi:hypothetical protein